MGKKKFFIIFGFVLLLLFILWGVYKFILLKRLLPQSNSILIEITNSAEKLSIKTDKTLANEEYEDLNIYIPNGVVKYEDNRDFERVIYVALDNSAPIKIQIRKYHKWIDTIEEYGINDMKYDYVSLFKDYGFSHEIELLEYYKKHMNEKRSIFTSSKHIMMDFIAETYTRDLWGHYGNNLEYNRILTGDLKGVVFKNRDRFHIVKVYNDDYIYEIWINDFSDSERDKIISSIYFD